MAAKNFSYKSEDFEIPSSRGEDQIFIRHYVKGEPLLHFYIVHGAVEHSGRHKDLVEFWLRSYNNSAVTVFDHIGHGRSGGTRAYVESFTDYVNDLLKVAEFVQPKLPENSKTFICSHSLGGLITLTRILDPAFGYPFPVKGLIFSSPCIKPQTVLAPVSLPLLEKLNKISPKLHLPMIYSGKDLTRDPERANDFDTDTLIPKYISVRMAKQVLEASEKIIGLSYYLKIPSLFLIAGKDKIVDPLSTMLFAHGIDKRLCETWNYPEHMHELWNEIDRQEIFQTMKIWVDKHLKETP